MPALIWGWVPGFIARLDFIIDVSQFICGYSFIKPTCGIIGVKFQRFFIRLWFFSVLPNFPRMTPLLHQPAPIWGLIQSRCLGSWERHHIFPVCPAPLLYKIVFSASSGLPACRQAGTPMPCRMRQFSSLVLPNCSSNALIQPGLRSEIVSSITAFDGQLYCLIKRCQRGIIFLQFGQSNPFIAPGHPVRDVSRPGC